MTDEITSDELRAVLDAYSPADWKPHARGIVFLGNTEEEAKWMFAALRKWAADEGYRVRIPHHSVSARGLAAPPSATTRYGSELDLAVGGILILDEFSEFDDHGLYNINKRIVSEKLPGVVVVGIDYLHGDDPEEFMRRLGHNASHMGVEVITIDAFEDLTPTSSRPDVEEALATVNRHRRRIGMAKLDPTATGWTDQDVLIEADRVTRLPNPLDVAPGDPVLAEMSGELETALLEQDLRTVDDVLASAYYLYGDDARETRALHMLVRSYGVLANPGVAELKRRLMP